MKRSILAVLIAIFFASWAFAQDAPVGKQSFTGTVELGMTIRELAELVSSGADVSAKLAGKAFLVVGTLGKPAIDESEIFSALAAFQEGVWVGTSTVSIVRIYIRFTGEAFAELAGSVKGVKAVALLDQAELAPAPEGGMALYFRVLSIRVVE